MSPTARPSGQPTDGAAGDHCWCSILLASPLLSTLLSGVLMLCGKMALPEGLLLTGLGSPAQLPLHHGMYSLSQACQEGFLLMEVHHHLGLQSEAHLLKVLHRRHCLLQLVVLLGR